MEEWKDIKNWEGYYQVSNYGRVRSLDRVVQHTDNDKTTFYKGVVITPKVNRGGYLFLTLYRQGQNKTITVHRLVALAFIPNPEDKPTVDHIDGNKLNNHVSNLRWFTVQEQTKHAYRLGLAKGRKGTKHHMVRLTESQVMNILNDLIEKKESINDISLRYDVGCQAISKINNGARWGHVMPELPRPIRTRSDAKRIYDSSSSPASRR